MTDTHVRSVWQRLGDAVETAMLSAMVAGLVGVGIMMALGIFVTPLAILSPSVLIWESITRPSPAAIAGLSGAAMGVARPRRFTRWPCLLGAVAAFEFLGLAQMMVADPASGREFLMGTLGWRELSLLVSLPVVGILGAAGVHLILTRRSPRAVSVSRIVLAVVGVTVIVPGAIWAIVHLP